MEIIDVRVFAFSYLHVHIHRTAKTLDLADLEYNSRTKKIHTRFVQHLNLTASILQDNFSFSGGKYCQLNWLVVELNSPVPDKREFHLGRRCK